MFCAGNIAEGGLPLSIWIPPYLFSKLGLSILFSHGSDCVRVLNIIHFRGRVRSLHRLYLLRQFCEFTVLVNFLYLLGKLLRLLVSVWPLSSSDARTCKFVNVESNRGSLRSLRKVAPWDLFAPRLLITSLPILDSVYLFDSHRWLSSIKVAIGCYELLFPIIIWDIVHAFSWCLLLLHLDSNSNIFWFFEI